MWKPHAVAVLLATVPLLGGCQWGVTANPSIVVDRPVALIDQPLRIEIRGVPTGAMVTVRAESQDEAGVDWTAAAQFDGTARGVIDLTHEAPRSGSYAGTDAMGLFWSLRPRAAHPEQVLYTMRSGDTATVTLSAETDGHRASVQVRRETIDPKVQRQPLATGYGGLVGTLLVPPGGSRHPAVIVLGGSSGGLDESWAALLASHGITALALAYFRVPAMGLPAELVDIPLEYFATALAWLRAQPAVDPAHVGVVGVSRGGELALLLAATYPQQLQAVVAYVPSSVVNGGITATSISTVAAWTVNGQPVPYAPFNLSAVRSSARGAVERPAFEEPLKDASAVAPAVIPVERIAGPLLLVSGTDDQLWPSDHYADLVISRRREHGVTYADVSLKYQGAGHFIRPPYLPTITNAYIASGRFLLYAGGTAAAYSKADADSWPRVIDFLQRAL